jgi:hypothetical protein
MTERNDHDMTDPPSRVTSEKDETASGNPPAATLQDGTPSRCPPYSYLEPTPPTVVVPHLSHLVLSRDDLSALFPWNAMVAVSPQ